MSALPLIGYNYSYTTCITCGIPFGSPIISRRRDDGKEFYCPNGHTQYFTETEAQRLSNKLAEANRLLEWQKSQTRMAENNLIRERKAARREANRIKKRIGNGVCPCCNRTFSDLARHMETKHKDYKLEAQIA